MASNQQLSQLFRNIGNGNPQDLGALRTELAALLKQNPDLNPVPLIKNAVKEALHEYDSEHPPPPCPQRMAIVQVAVPRHKHITWRPSSGGDGGASLCSVRPVSVDRGPPVVLVAYDDHPVCFDESSLRTYSCHSSL